MSFLTFILIALTYFAASIVVLYLWNIFVPVKMRFNLSEALDSNHVEDVFILWVFWPIWLLVALAVLVSEITNDEPEPAPDNSTEDTKTSKDNESVDQEYG